MDQQTQPQAIFETLHDRFLLRFGIVPQAHVMIPGRLKLFGYNLHDQQATLSMSIDTGLHLVFTPINEPILHVMMPGYPLLTLDWQRLDIFTNEYNTPIALLKLIFQTIRTEFQPPFQGIKLFLHSEMPTNVHVGYSTAFIIGVLSAVVPSFLSLPLSSQVELVHRIEKKVPYYSFHPHDAWILLNPGLHHGYWVNGEAKTRKLDASLMRFYRFYTLKFPKKTIQEPWEWDIPNLIHDGLKQEKMDTLASFDQLWLANHYQRLIDTYGKRTVDSLSFLLDEQRRVIQSIVRYEQEDWNGFTQALFEQERQRISLLPLSPSALKTIDKKTDFLRSLTPTGKWVRYSINEDDVYLGWSEKDQLRTIHKMIHRHFPQAAMHVIRLHDKKLKILKS